MLELSLRPAHNDHRVLGDLIAAGVAGWSGRSQPLFQRIVLGASVAAAQGQLARDAGAAGIPVSIDPMTFLLQHDVAPDSAWAKLPFGRSAAMKSHEMGSSVVRETLVRQVVDFQLESGASTVSPPYFYARDPRDPLFSYNLSAIREARTYLDALNLRHGLLPVFCGRVDGFSHPESWPQGLDWFARASRDNGAEMAAVLLSPVGDFSDGYEKLFYFFKSVQRLEDTGLATSVWRQGALGPALLAAGASGYETGLQHGNKTDLSALASSRRVPSPEAKPTGGGGGLMYVARIGRWLTSKQVASLHEHNGTKALLLCDDALGCCPSGYIDTLANRRSHAVRSHARRVAAIAAMPPHVTWRMHHVAKEASEAADSIALMNKVLQRKGVSPINPASHKALARIAEDISRSASSAA